MPPLRVMPDSNVWRYIVSMGAVQPVRKEAKRHAVEIVACPAVLYEALRDSNAQRRRPLVDALTLGSWTRLMPEAYTEADEVRAEITRLHPEWLQPRPDLARWHRLRSDWQSAAWQRARRDTRAEAMRLRARDGGKMAAARAERREFRQRAIGNGWTFESVPLDLTDSFVRPGPGWDGEPFEAWRGVGLERWRETLLTQKGAAWDWLGPWLSAATILSDLGSWNAFWTRETSKEYLPLQWLRWAFDIVQSTQKITNGSPVDNQIATYLPQSDVFVSSDRNFIHQIEKIRPYCPIRLGRTRLVPADRDAVDAVLQIIAGAEPGRSV